MIDIKPFIEVIPTSESNLKRLKFLQEEATDTRVAVFGKFNHGKSTLLNAIIGKEIFKAADKRETTEIREYKHQDIIWVDTPGLDADVNGEDDRKAREGAFKIADFLFLVHSVKTGELDKYEVQLYRDLMKQDHNYHKKMFLILTQADQLEKEDLLRVIARIKEQFPDLIKIPVSATRYLRGIMEDKSIFIEKSGMGELFKLTKTLFNGLQLWRNNEKKRLVEKVKTELNEKKALISSEMVVLQQQLSKKQKTFNTDVEQYINKVQKLNEELEYLF